MSQKAAFAPDTVPEKETRSSEVSREVAYNIGLFLKAEEVGESPRERLDLLVRQAFGHYDEWFVRQNAPYVRPFMAALTAEALIDYCEQKRKISEKLSRRLRRGWIGSGKTRGTKGRAFKYTDREGVKGPNRLPI